MKKPLVLTILDGYGLNTPDKFNAIAVANTPVMDRLWNENPHTSLDASGMAVGLPEGQMGNSEVGHTNIGAGRVVYQELTRITKEISDGTFFENPAFVSAFEKANANGGAVHLIGLLSSGGVHSHNTHLYALVEMGKRMGSTVYVHGILDGRDVPPSSAADFAQELDEKMAEIGAGKIATVMGRFYAMDRDKRWDRVEKAYRAMTLGEGVQADNAADAIRESYKNGVTDEFVEPTVVCKDGAVKSGDSVIFFNFRPDRAREITRAFVDGEFDGFAREKLSDLFYVCFTQYDATMPNVEVAFKPQSLNNTFGEYLSKCGKTQLRIAETEKYAHVTFFFNGGVEKEYEGEDRALISSPKVATYDLQPEMSAVEVCDKVVERIESGKYDAIILNFANCDMVGHTGIFDAAVKAVETVDTCVGRVEAAVKKMDGIMLVTADHGNADYMFEADGSPFTAHTTNPVPFIVVGKDCTLREGGVLADIAPTMLGLLDLPQPEEMTGKTIIL